MLSQQFGLVHCLLRAINLADPTTIVASTTEYEHVLRVVVSDLRPFQHVVELRWQRFPTDSAEVVRFDQEFPPDLDRRMPTGLFSFEALNEGIQLFVTNLDSVADSS